MSNVLEVVIGIVSVILLGIINLALKAYIEWLRERSNSLIESEKHYSKSVRMSQFKEAKVLLDDMIQTAVIAIEQTKAAELREAVKAGKVDRQLLCNLAGEAASHIAVKLSNQMKSLLHEGIENLDVYVNDKIEESVSKLKQKKA